MKWNQQRIGDLCTVGRGSSPRPINDNRFFDGGEIPWIKVADATASGKYLLKTKLKVNALGASFSRLLPPGSLIICTSGTLGLPIFLGVEGCIHDGWLYTYDYRGLDPEFFYHFLQTQKAYFASVAYGAAIQNINTEILRNTKICLPPIDEQRRMADVLKSYDDLIENNRRRMALLEESARLLYREWFVRLRFPGHESTRIVNGVPEGWERLHVGDFVERGQVSIQTGPFGTQLKASDYTEEGTPVINVRNIGYGDLRPDKLEYVPEAITERLTAHLLREGDIVFGRKGAVDRHLLVSSAQHGWMQGSDCIRLRPLSEKVCPVLLTFAFREPSHHEWMLTQCGNKATMASLNQEVISRIPVIVPSHALLTEFREFAKDALDQINKLALQNQKLRAARDLLLPKLMSGEIEV